jgi:DNA primase
LHDISDEARSVLEAATSHYQSVLQRSANAQGYLRKRGLNDDTIAKLCIGYAGGDLGRALFERGVDLTLAAHIGLLMPRGELMRGRIVFPVLDEQSRPVWMIGRALDGAMQPKYLGLPDGAVHKHPMMFGDPKRGVIWIEGAFDLAALVQWGLDADYLLIALLGTAHAQTMAMLRDHFAATSHIIALDQDDAGEQAAQAMMAQMRNTPSTHQNVRVRWAGAKDCGELLMLGHPGQSIFLQSLQSHL